MRDYGQGSEGGGLVGVEIETDNEGHLGGHKGRGRGIRGRRGKGCENTYTPSFWYYTEVLNGI